VKFLREMDAYQILLIMILITVLIITLAAYSLGHHAITAWQSVSHTTIQSLSVSVQKPQEVAPVMRALLPPLEVRR